MILLLCSFLVKHIWSAVSNSGFCCARERWRYWSESSKGCGVGWGIGTSYISGESERWDCLAWRREGSG